MVSNLAALWMGAVYEKVKADDCRLTEVSCGVALHSRTVGLRFCRPHFNFFFARNLKGKSMSVHRRKARKSRAGRMDTKSKIILLIFLLVALVGMVTMIILLDLPSMAPHRKGIN